MEPALVIARCEAGPDLAAQLGAWASDRLAVEIVSESEDARFEQLLLSAFAILHI
jgi:hypothetical protein